MSVVIRLDTLTREASFLAKPGTFKGAHDGCYYAGLFYVTEADNNSLAWLDPVTCDVKRLALQPDHYFVRGLTAANGDWLIGFSPLRTHPGIAQIGVYDRDTLEKKNTFMLPPFYGADRAVAVHTLACA